MSCSTAALMSTVTAPLWAEMPCSMAFSTMGCMIMNGTSASRDCWEVLMWTVNCSSKRIF